MGGGGGACFLRVGCFLVEGRVDLSDNSEGVLDGILLTPMIDMGGDGGLLSGSGSVGMFSYVSVEALASSSVISTLWTGMLCGGMFW